jgi:MFS family permease
MASIASSGAKIPAASVENICQWTWTSALFASKRSCNVHPIKCSALHGPTPRLTTQGFILSSFFLTYALMQIPGGMLADRFKPRAVIAVATLGWGLFQAIAAVSLNAWVLVLTRLGLGAFEAPIYPAGGKLNAIWMTSNERARGATLLDGGVPLGAAFGSIIIAGLIAEFDSWRCLSSLPESARCFVECLPGDTSEIILPIIHQSTRPRQISSQRRTRTRTRSRRPPPDAE